MRFCVIINTIRRPEELVVRSVRAALAQGQDVGVVLVDQNPLLLQLPPDLLGNFRLSHQGLQVPCISSARNGAQYSVETEWLIFCDDDGYLAPDYLERLREEINQHPETSIFAGAIRRIDTGGFYSSRQALGGDLRHFWNTKLLMGSNFAIRRSTFESLGKFDELFGIGGPNGSSEETDLAWRAYFRGVSMRYVPGLVVYHPAASTGEIPLERKKAYLYGVGKGRLVRKWIGAGRLIAFFELCEMLLVPPAIILLTLLRGEVSRASVKFWGWLGRCFGLIISGARLKPSTDRLGLKDSQKG